MKANNYISNKERRLIQIAAFILVIFVVLNFCFETINTYNYSVSERQKELAAQAGAKVIKISGSYPPPMPAFHFASIFIFIALLRAKRFIASLLLTIFYLSIFVYGLVARFNGGRLGGEEFSPEFNFFHKIYYGARDFDILASVFILILVFWQIRILLRILIKSLQRKDALP